MQASSLAIPLVTDLDGTLVRGDTLVEGVKALLRRKPWMLCVMPFWVLRGRPYFKSRLAPWSAAACRSMPLNGAVLALLHEARAAGRPVVLATAAHEIVAQGICQRVPLLETYFATVQGHNLKGVHKAVFLQEKYGKKGFDYCGDSEADMPVWAAARKAYVTGKNVRHWQERDATLIPLPPRWE